VTLEPNPSIDMVKSASQSTYALGDVITYTFTVTNNGTVTLTNVSVSDPLAGLSAIAPASVATLAPGATQVFTATYTFTQDDVDVGSLLNTATATGTPPIGLALSVDAKAVVVAFESPGPPEPPLEVTVGWDSSPIDKMAVIAPWIALATAIIAGAALLMFRRRRTQS
jgi:uncharacterized repeat protein (TIGR01451 family)